MSPHLSFTILGTLVISACTALMGRDTRRNHWLRFAYNATSGFAWIWAAAWAMHWLHS
jgi:hypothetical protein